AMDAAAVEDALRAIDDALSLVDDDEDRRAKLLERKGWTVRALGDFEGCIAIWNDVLPVYQRIGEVEAAARLCWETGYQFIWLDRFADAFAAYSRGVELLGDHRSPTLATLVGATGALFGLAGLVDQADAQFTEATAIAHEFADDLSLGRIEWGRTMSNWSHLRTAEAIDSGRASIEHLRRAQTSRTSRASRRRGDRCHTHGSLPFLPCAATSRDHSSTPNRRSTANPRRPGPGSVGPPSS